MHVDILEKVFINVEHNGPNVGFHDRRGERSEIMITHEEQC